VVKEILDSHEKFYCENTRHLNRFVRDTLLPELEYELTRERGLWGPFNPSHLGKYLLRIPRITEILIHLSRTVEHALL